MIKLLSNLLINRWPYTYSETVVCNWNWLCIIACWFWEYSLGLNLRENWNLPTGYVQATCFSNCAISVTLFQYYLPHLPGKIKTTTSTHCRWKYWVRQDFAKRRIGSSIWILLFLFPFPSFQSRNGRSHKAGKIFDTAINIYICSSLPFHYTIIVEQLLYKHLGMQQWTKPTRSHCHEDYKWKTPETFWFILLSL